MKTKFEAGTELLKVEVLQDWGLNSEEVKELIRGKEVRKHGNFYYLIQSTLYIVSEDPGIDNQVIRL